MVVPLKTYRHDPRDLYMNQIEPFIQKPFIKVLTGIRRSGKSVILRLVKEKLKERGAQEDHIVYII